MGNLTDNEVLLVGLAVAIALMVIAGAIGAARTRDEW